VHSALIGATPTVISQNLNDPWLTQPTEKTYGYKTGTHAAFGDWFIIYTKGPKADTNPDFNDSNQKVEYTGTGRVVSNAPVVKQ